MDFSQYFEVSAKSPTGLIWRQRSKKDSEKERIIKMWNTRWAGKPAGALSVDQKGYRAWKVEVSGRSYVVSRIVYEMGNGAIPEGMEIDHINHDSLDNRPENLRLGTKSRNQANRIIQKNNTSGFKGVGRSGKKWSARIGNGGAKFLGVFDTPELAHAAYMVAAQDSYGEFHRAG